MSSVVAVLVRYFSEKKEKITKQGYFGSDRLGVNTHNDKARRPVFLTVSLVDYFM